MKVTKHATEETQGRRHQKSKTGIWVRSHLTTTMWFLHVFTPVCHSVHRGVCHTPRADTPWADTPSASGQTPPSAAGQTPPSPPGRHPLPGQTPLRTACWDTGNKRAVHILLECNLVLSFFLSSCVNSTFGNHTKHFKSCADDTKRLCRCRQVQTDRMSVPTKRTDVYQKKKNLKISWKVDKSCKYPDNDFGIDISLN